MRQTVVLGAGFGGITVATELRRLLGSDHEVTLVDRSERFSMGLRKLWELVGEGTIADGSRERDLLEQQGIDVARSEIAGIAPAERAAWSATERWQGDFLVVALGAEPRPDLVPGLTEHAHDVWNPTNVARASDALANLKGGRVAIVIAGGPYPCPPAPYECAFLVDEFLREHDLREQTELVVSTFQPILLPNAGREGSTWLGQQLDARDIEWHTGRKVERIDAGQVVYEDGALAADLIIGVPPHRVPAVIAESGLTGEGQWIKVDPGTLTTEHPGVFAIGDVTQIPLANGLPLPKAGLMAELEGQRVAAGIAAQLLGQEPPEPFDGAGHCFLEMGRSEATLVEGEFFAEPEPRVQVREPSAANAEAKRRFESERLARWFGS